MTDNESRASPQDIQSLRTYEVIEISSDSEISGSHEDYDTDHQKGYDELNRSSLLFDPEAQAVMQKFDFSDYYWSDESGEELEYDQTKREGICAFCGLSYSQGYHFD